MAFSATCQWQVMNGGSDGTTGNGGGFDPGQNAGMLTDGAATVANTNSPVFTSASYNFVAGDAAARIYIHAGTNWTPGWYTIASVGGNAATLTGNIGQATLQDGGLSTVIGCATTGSPTGATWSIDYSQQTGAEITYTDIVIDGTTNTDGTSAGHPFGKQQVGNIWAVSSGTGFTVQRVTLASIPSGVIGRFDKSLGTLSSTGGNAKMGGALVSVGQSGALHVAGNTIWLKYNATAFTTTSVTNNVTVGKITLVAGNALTVKTMLVGYNTTSGDGDTQTTNRPTMKCGVNSSVLIIHGNGASVRNIIFDGNRANFTLTRGITSATGSFEESIFNCKFTGFNNTAVSYSAGSTAGYLMINCEVTDCVTNAAIIVSGSGDLVMVGCNIHDNAIDGLSLSSTGTCAIYDTIFDTNANGAAGTGIVSTSTARLYMAHCTFYGNGSHGIDCQVACFADLFNVVFETNGGYGLNIGVAASKSIQMIKCAFYNNTSGTYPTANVPSANVLGEIIGSGSFFTSASGADFTPNNTAGAGASIRAVANPTTYPGGSTNFRDVGAAQHQDSGAAVVTTAFTFAG